MKPELYKIELGPPWFWFCHSCDTTIGGEHGPYYTVHYKHPTPSYRLCVGCGDRLRIMLELAE